MGSFPSRHKNDSEGSSGLLFMRAYNSWHGEVKRQLRALNLTHPQFVVLTSLGYLSQGESAVTQVMVARVSGMDVMSVSQVLGLLERDGLVVRHPHPCDTRAKVVEITMVGQECLEAAVPLVERIDEQFFGSLGVKGSDFLDMLSSLGVYEFGDDN